MAAAAVRRYSRNPTQAFNASGLSVPNIGVRPYSVHQRIALLITNRFVSAESGSTLRFNGARFGIKVLSVDYAFQPWPVGIVTLKKRTLS